MTVVEPMKAGTFTISSGYGGRRDPFSGAWTGHNGLDYAAAIGTPIYAVADGVVVEGKDRTGVYGFGSWIWLDCQAAVGRDFIYGHVKHSGILVRAGDRVVAGQQIGVVGNEGNSTGPHLHFEVWGPPGRVGGDHEDPAAWLARHVTRHPAPSTPQKEAPMADQFPTDLVLLTPNDDGVRSGAPQFIGIHTFEAPRTMTARAMAEYQQRPSAGGSYHIVVDGKGESARENDDIYRPWAAGFTGNLRGMHLSFGAYAKDSRALWLRHDEQLREGARAVAFWCRKYGIPVRFINATQLRNGEKGICGHAEVSAAWREVNHTDPGPNFPWDVFLTYVKAYVGGTAAPAPSASAPAPAPAPVDLETFDQTLSVIRQQLTGGANSGYPGWDQLDDRSLVDGLAVVGTTLGVPGFFIPAKSDGKGPVEYREAKVDTIRHQLTGGRFTGYPGWPQLGGRTVVDAVAAIGAHLKIAGFRDVKK